MRRLIVVFNFLLALTLSASLHAQVDESARARSFKLYAGAVGSVFQPDYAGQGIAQTSPNRLYGVGAFVDADFTRWIQIEGETRWLNFNQYAGISEKSFMVGPRVPIVEYKHLVPYGKFLIGIGNGSFLTSYTTAFAYGGGLDYRLGKRWSIRAIDFEYQSWRISPTLSPYGGSAGIAYRIF